MTVAEAIIALAKMPPDAKLVVLVADYWFSHIEEVDEIVLRSDGKTVRIA